MEKNRDKTEIRAIQNANLKTDAGPGRPIGQKNYATLYREALIKLAKLNDKEPEDLEMEILSKGIMNARAGDYRFYKDLLDRLLGTAINKNETKVEAIVQFNLSEKKVEQINDIALDE